MGSARTDPRVHGRGNRRRPAVAFAGADLRRRAHAHRRGLDRARSRHGPAGRAAAGRRIHLRPQAGRDHVRTGQWHHPGPAGGIARLLRDPAAGFAASGDGRGGARRRAGGCRGQRGRYLADRPGTWSPEPERGGRVPPHSHRPVRVHRDGRRGPDHHRDRLRPCRRHRDAYRRAADAARGLRPDQGLRPDLPGSRARRARAGGGRRGDGGAPAGSRDPRPAHLGDHLGSAGRLRARARRPGIRLPRHPGRPRGVPGQWLRHHSRHLAGGSRARSRPGAGLHHRVQRESRHPQPTPLR
jgi:hypothetical protein